MESSLIYKVHCFFRNENQSPSKEILGLFTSGGLFSDRLDWIIDIPRENITVNTDIAAIEQWLIKITMHEGLNIYDTDGTLLDLVRETECGDWCPGRPEESIGSPGTGGLNNIELLCPILQWNLGRILTEMEVKQLQLDVEDIRVAKSPCANDVALMGLYTKSTSNGVFIGKTISGFWTYEECIWYDLTEIIYAELNDDFQEQSFVDLKGLTVDYIKGKLWYNEKCFANRESFEVDYVTITFNRNRTLSESSSCFFSKEPFHQWLPCLYSTYKNERFIPHVITFLIDQETESGIYLLHMKETQETFVTVSMLKDGKPSPRPKFPSFQFPSTFTLPVGMVFHPRSHFLYVYGNEIWVSMDGGNTFEILCSLFLHYARKSSHSFYTSDIVFMLEDGTILMTKAGSKIYGELGIIKDKVFTLYYDQLGYIHKLTPQTFDAGSKLLGHGSSTSIFGKDFSVYLWLSWNSPCRPEMSDLGFETALVPQYISRKEMQFFAYVPLTMPTNNQWQKRFKSIHLRKTMMFSKTGNDIIEPFVLEDSKESPCLLSSLEIKKNSGDAYFTLNLLSKDPQNEFKSTDVEKTVLVPGHSSFLITEIKNQWTASALATMPQTIKSTLTFSEGSWFLYNFGTVGGRTWSIVSRLCNYWIQVDSLDFMSLNLVKYIDVGNKVDFQFKIIPKGISFLSSIVVGNCTYKYPPKSLCYPSENLGEQGGMEEKKYFMRKLSLKGSTSLSLVIWEASRSCFAVTLLPTIKSSCSYLRTMHHSPGRHIPPEDWISGIHKDGQGFNMIKTLPINYRPPSNMGISIPLTDNFYHADPSKPIPRNQFHKSKETGKYKQCANVTSRAMCNCSEHQKISHAVAFSDCKEKVHRFKFPVTQYPVVLEIFNERDKVSAEPPYLVTMTEVNMRKNWQLRHNEPENVKKMRDYLEPLLKTPVYNPLGLNLTIKGSELFHFKVSVVPGVSFCDLNEEFQIYVDEVPLPFPGHALIAVATSVVLGGLIFVAFVFQLRNIHPLRALKGFVRGNPALTSATTVTS
ncbi:Cation channel sperm-associated auxiliary subunit beta [Apodemus speciosus]|uniref:Cation channel sperm-associated auxiliary subunit beta n=1 Tax=Apodemus speciosus TaxID=105296 RepID=A0ABQ0FEQ2_APOSI